MVVNGYRVMRTSLLVLPLLVIAVGPLRAADPKRDKKLEEHIDKALAFLKNTQERDGSWTVRGRGNPAITALAVMAFLSAGHVPGEGPYGDTVEKGVRWVLQSQNDNGLIANEGHQEMYHHGICTLMLAEVAGMVKGKLADEVRAKLVKAVKLTIKGQRTDGDNSGGWDYVWRQTGRTDISCTGWQVMSLRAAKNLGCDVPAAVIERSIAYVKRCHERRTGSFSYQPRTFNVTPACTGTGILVLEVCGKEQHLCEEVIKGGESLRRNPPRWNQGFFYYGMYYGSQASFQMGGVYWKDYRKHMHDTLFSRQLGNGSWSGGGADYSAGGQNYATAMCVLALTVEYRFLPIYQRDEDSKEANK